MAPLANKREAARIAARPFKSSSGKTPQSETGKADPLKSPYQPNMCWGTTMRGKR
jgi:hypothetical protein